MASEIHVASRIFSSTFSHFHPLSSTFINVYPLSSSFTQFYPLSSTVTLNCRVTMNVVLNCHQLSQVVRSTNEKQTKRQASRQKKNKTNKFSKSDSLPKKQEWRCPGDWSRSYGRASMQLWQLAVPLCSYGRPTMATMAAWQDSHPSVTQDHYLACILSTCSLKDGHIT